MHCAGCSLEFDSLTVEHIVPESLGGRLAARALCESCNREVFAPADAAIRSFAWVIECAARFGVHGKRGRLAKSRAIVADVGGGRLALRAGPDGLVPVDHPFMLSGTEFLIPGSTLEGFRARAAARGEAVVVTGTVDMSGMKEDELEGSVSYPPDLWPRFAAKVALGLAFIVCEPDWFESATARELQGIVRAPVGQWIELGGQRIPAVPARLAEDSPERALVAPDHIVRLGLTASGEPAVSILLFGEIRYVMRLPGELQLRTGVDLTSGLHWYVPLGQPAHRTPQTAIELATQLMAARALDDLPNDSRPDCSWTPDIRRALELVFAAGYLRFADSGSESAE